MGQQGSEPSSISNAGLWLLDQNNAFFQYGLCVFVLWNLEFLMQISVSGLILDIVPGPVILFQSCKSCWDLPPTSLPPHPTRDVSTWSLVFYLHILLVLSSLEESDWPDRGCLAGCFPCWKELISYVHSSWSSEAFTDLCPTSHSLHLSPHWYTQEQRQARTREEKRKLGAGCQRAQKPSAPPSHNSLHLLMCHSNKRNSKTGSEVWYFVDSGVISCDT